MTTDTRRPPLAGVASVIPWRAMTPEQRREHLKIAHGWDIRRTSDADCTWAHNLDHRSFSAAGLLVPHTHDKETR